MPITERLRAVGQWTIRFKPSTPRSILLDTLDPMSALWGHVIVTAAHVDPTAVTVLSVARFAGVYREKRTEFEISGPGPAAWLGDEDGKGDLIESSSTFNKTAASFSTWVGDLRPSSLDAGSVAALGGSLTHRFVFISRREALDYVCDYFSADWVVRPDLSLDAGAAADLFVTTPTVAAMRRSGGRDLNVTGLPDPQVDLAQDGEDYTTRVVLLATGGGNASAVGAANISPATSYKDKNNAAVKLVRLEQLADTKPGNEGQAATAQLNRFNTLRRQVTLSSDLYDIGGDITPGDYIWLYDPELGLVDTTNQVSYRGEVIFPVKIRVLGYTWPVQQGMGVYFRSGAGTVTDLTDWVEWEAGATTVEVGTLPRKIFR